MSWREEYVLALKERDATQAIDYGIIEAYDRLAARVAALEAEKQLWLISAHASDAVPSSSTTTTVNLTPASVPASAQLQRDLAEALRANGDLQARVRLADAELDQLRTQTRRDRKVNATLAAERTMFVRRLKDREAELKEKAELLTHVQDEVMTLELELGHADKRAKAAKKEYDDLVARWMARMEVEAQEMNDKSMYS